MTNDALGPPKGVRRPWAAAISALLLLVVAVIDYVTGPRLDVTVLYFIPIVYAAWSLGDLGAFAAAVLATISTVPEINHVLKLAGGSTTDVVFGDIVRLLVYLFVAVVVRRLSTSVLAEARTAGDLRLSNARLQEIYDKMSRDMDAARQLQQSVLALVPPRSRGSDVGVVVRYARAVGGDFVNAGILDDKVYVCIADISGKGVPAALFTTLLKHVLYDAHKQGLRGSSVVDHINSVLWSSLPDDSFATLFYGELDEGSGALQYVNAGHPPGLVHRQRTGEVEEAEPTCLALGILETGCFESPHGVVLLEPGDALTLYTDGATEARTPEGVMLGEGMIKRLASDYSRLSPQDMAEHILADILQQVDEDGVDDIAILCLRYEGANPQSPTDSDRTGSSELPD